MHVKLSNLKLVLIFNMKSKRQVANDRKNKKICNTYIQFTWFDIKRTFTSQAPNNLLLLQR